MLSSCVLVLVLANLAPCSLELVGIAPGPPDAEEDERGSPRRKAATTIGTATAEEDVKDCDRACASSRTCLPRVFSKSTWSIPIRTAAGVLMLFLDHL